ncbi:hypothetical protein BT69DRAFT_994668 [Atractiella rhizophila]|nr:hypothetical protein BT69DRAFT_994668 [Atractiella rhizophila]
MHTPQLFSIVTILVAHSKCTNELSENAMNDINQPIWFCWTRKPWYHYADVFAGQAWGKQTNMRNTPDPSDDITYLCQPGSPLRREEREAYPEEVANLSSPIKQ